MTTSGEGKVIVRVEVVIEGLGAAAKVTTSEAAYAAALGPPRRTLPERDLIKPLAIDSFPPNVPVYIIDGQNCIEASGTSPLVGGAYAQMVQAIAYPKPDVTPPATPPAGAVTDMPAGNKNWSFTRVKGNPVPGATYDNILDGPDNSTFAVWYFYNSSSPSESEFSSFHGYIASSASASQLAIAHGTAGPAVLHAVFTGALGALGTVTLTWNGVSWAGVSSNGSAVLSFRGHGRAFELLSAGPATAFIAAAQPSSLQPFSWAVEGAAQGALAGHFRVTITE